MRLGEIHVKDTKDVITKPYGQEHEGSDPLREDHLDDFRAFAFSAGVGKRIFNDDGLTASSDLPN
jgi:hypothetical protein